MSHNVEAEEEMMVKKTILLYLCSAHLANYIIIFIGKKKRFELEDGDPLGFEKTPFQFNKV